MTLVQRVKRVFEDPNPIVRKELLALLRTPVYVRAVVVALVGLALLVMIVALAVGDRSRDTTEAGRVLFQTLYGGIFLAMALIGPTFGATAIVQEREARTLDALTLSSMGPRRVVLGKLAAVFVAMTFIPMVSVPMLGLVVLFGGVSLGHLAVATLYLLLFGAVGVGFGVAVSARAATTRRALLGTIPAALFATFTLGSVLAGFGEVLGRGHALTLAGPFFFADAYFALPWGALYVVALVVAPAYFIGVDLWLFYAVACAGLMDPTEDRALPLKRWTVGALGLGVAALAGSVRALAVDAAARAGLAFTGQVLAALLGIALLFAFVGEPRERTRRMDLHPPGPLSRAFLPPTLAPSMLFVLAAVGLAVLAGPVAVCGVHQGLMLFGLWALAYLAALGGFMGWLAQRNPASGATNARVFGVLVLFLTLVALWLVAALLGALDDPLAHPPWVLVLSPSWAVGAVPEAFLGASRRGIRSDAGEGMLAGAAVWGVVGAVFLGLMLSARARARARAPG